MAQSPEVQVSVLGPLQVAVDGHVVEVPGRRRQAVLAVLAMSAPAPATTDGLIDAVWPDDVPGSGRAALQSHISRLRRHLGPAASRLSTTGTGYRLDLGDGELDATRAAALVSEARGVAGGDPAGAAELLGTALGLWRGAPLAGLDDVAPLAAWARSLSELCLDASDLLARCHIHAGDPAAAVRLATETLGSEPLRETTVVVLVRALTAQGRAADALRTAHEFRRRLAEETGLEPTPALAQAEHAAASGDEPTMPGKGPPAGRRRIPAPGGPTVGRAAELVAVARLLESERLVTVVGPGGVGKTHLAVEVARRAARRRDVTMVQLSAVTGDDAVVDALADALGLQADAGDPIERCALRLCPGRQVLVLDSCEHVLDAVRDVITTLLAECPRLTTLVTSRERLGVAAEQTCWLGPLAVPDAGQHSGLASVPSVALFLDRARRARPGFDPGGVGLATVARIVRSLDGLPLAIELAAGRLSSMSVDDLDARLDRALDFLAAPPGRPGPTARHRTLRATVEWSYDLLGPDEQRLFRNLAVFPGGFDLLTAEAVAADIGVTTDPAAALAHLVDTCMVLADLDAGPRYRMLDTLRAFASDRLATSGERVAAERRLVRWALELAVSLEATAATADEPRADARLRDELANMRAAWHTARQANDVDNAAELVVSLYWAVSWREITEVWRWALELAADPLLEGHPVQAAVLGTASEAAWFSAGDLDRAEALARRGLAVARPDDARGRAISSWGLGDVHLFRGRHDAAQELVLAARHGTAWEAEGFAQAAMAAAYAGDLEGARRLLGQAAERAVAPTLAGYVRYVTGEVDGIAGEHRAAESAYREAIAAAHTSGATFLEGIASVGLVSVLVAQGRTDEALLGYRELIARWERTGGWTQQWTTLRNLADLLEGVGDTATADALRRAADRAPEAAAVNGSKASRRLTGADAGDVDRQAVLATARDAIARALGD